ncbi:uncharacterized protein PHACADRAFT_192626 [Phanerochaete carnosa HHB-10118-sp]|uniref:Uncharacterized protein n=1 Tax=Phanerochaete carnosa (strain HHB-10118-sp) TaxID=650164 RepID=K5WEI7_PHACS|nr:uncharacterized protein PHACADRAFT_192626 [Phanerochaete carnosa HHB-10118-sp]EKM57479.1 hypothetical protein PHACADRAFT_192626 [Phanerochaete carnosa HHB-10118-sp]
MVYLNRTSIASNRSFRFSLLHLTDSLVGNLGAPLQLDTMSGEEPVQGASSYQSSYDPLASGLLLDPEEGPLLSTSTLSRDSFLETPISSSFYTSPVQVSPLEVNDLFDDTEYGVSILSVMHRGDTEMKEREKGSVGSGVDDSEICDLLERDRERFTTSFVEA